ncbi:MAG: plasminogen-binding N-terminal domain-containing protein [Sulfuricurvum sp.]|uniref:plasminogen-binding N-terminal domain-containing protein n=1 Tax=Sulfuricurvum sp. TaxID=2025608 RepID=UPI002633AB04|nr:plasminogen-binding N-terminal domain-containing protein [Sulfuricurvum sp.]MDD2828580.1 plasminogen-binding N-terminal domain-containing protein [Sulfuricurvum sp.]MDD4948257.1 plasminogen-binding N-terminal domain-containing protein [Sulfuricurvum sp.]
MRIWFLLLLALVTLEASSISTPLLDVQGDHGTIESAELKVGMSGFVVRHFDTTHSAIIANARVTQTTPPSNRALIIFSEYDGIRQNSLPNGKWSPKAQDEVIIASDYGRGLLIAPNDDTYNAVSKSIPNIEWTHPDLYATYLSHEGHPTPLVSDFHRFCSAGSVGLLYIQTTETLFTLDCKNFSLLQTLSSNSIGKESKTPFYSRVPTIRSAWWGEGSSKLESYEPYYLEQIALNNPKNKELYELYKAKFGEKSALLRHFDFKE